MEVEQMNTLDLAMKSIPMKIKREEAFTIANDFHTFPRRAMRMFVNVRNVYSFIFLFFEEAISTTLATEKGFCASIPKKHSGKTCTCTNTNYVRVSIYHGRMHKDAEKISFSSSKLKKKAFFRDDTRRHDNNPGGQ